MNYANGYIMMNDLQPSNKNYIEFEKICRLICDFINKVKGQYRI